MKCKHSGSFLVIDSSTVPILVNDIIKIKWEVGRYMSPTPLAHGRPGRTEATGRGTVREALGQDGQRGDGSECFGRSGACSCLWNLRTVCKYR